MLLLCGVLFFTPDIFVSRYTTSPQIFLQGAVGFGMLLVSLCKKTTIHLPPMKYLVLIMLCFCYHLARDRGNFESFVTYMTIICTFLLFYGYWKETLDNHIAFTLFLCLGVVLSIWGLGQYAGWISKRYSVFTMTGPFNNPAGISASLALLFPFSLYFCYTPKNKKIRRINILPPLLMAGTIILSGSRAAILSIAVSGILFVIHIMKRNKRLKLSIFHYIAITLFCIFLSLGMYFIKKDSADGRLLIWHCSGQLMKQASLFGHGYNGFQARYMTEQANYFSMHPESRFAMLADNTSHPFNEYMKETVEYGIIGLALILMPIVILFSKNRKKSILKLFIAQLSIVSIAICALFSYPLDYPFIVTMGIALIAYTLVNSNEMSMIVSIPTSVRISLLLFSLTLIVAVGHRVNCESMWKNIAHGSLTGNTKKILHLLHQYDGLHKNTYLGKNGLFLYNYGAELNHIGKYEQSNEILSLCSKYMNDYDMHMMLADNYQHLNCNEEAERHYSLAHKMIPSKFIPLYALVKLYERNGQNEKIYAIAEEIINKKAKVTSLKVTQIKNEMRQLISNMADTKGLPPNRIGDVKVKTDLK